MKAASRRRVVWIGPSPSEKVATEFKNRDLVLLSCDAGQALDELVPAAAIVFQFDPQSPATLGEQFEAVAAKAADVGTLLVVTVDQDRDFHNARQRVNAAGGTVLRPTVLIPNADHVVAHLVAGHCPGPGPGETDITVISGTAPPSSTGALFLRRAFWDCRSVTIEALGGGRSAEVYAVHAVFRDSRAGPRPLPFFAKIDRLAKYVSELGKYDEFVAHFIPANLRPHLDPSRCVRGATHGMLVGTFVEQSEPLWDVARRGMGVGSLHALFDTTLRGWRLQPYVQSAATPAVSPMVSVLGEQFRASRVGKERWERARDLGARRTPPALERAVAEADMLPHRTAPMHGDLHAQNVRVRGPDAVLIDFNSTRIGPLVADPACLDVSLAFGIDRSDRDEHNASWRDTIDSLFAPAHLQTSPPPAFGPGRREWLWRCARQLRQIALADVLTVKEYQLAVALFLIRHAGFAADSGWAPEEYRRAYAYVVADRLINDILAK